ncbi:hypothetical protein HJG60_008722 [Phyllostomus discolor]|uniref:Uncharacterized protein n=1 Tax=Phyllostomus discolor TaxID=89673 RepID=A0A833YTW6_9CHIR|nr:hypothetical protein HJG60_008722 [Phyllostomus discolor]
MRLGFPGVLGWVSAVSRAARPPGRGPTRRGDAADRGGQGLAAAVPALLRGTREHISCSRRSPGNCPRDLGASERFKTCLRELERTLISESGDGDSFIGDRGQGVQALETSAVCSEKWADKTLRIG